MYLSYMYVRQSAAPVASHVDTKLTRYVRPARSIASRSSHCLSSVGDVVGRHGLVGNGSTLGRRISLSLRRTSDHVVVEGQHEARSALPAKRWGRAGREGHDLIVREAATGQAQVTCTWQVMWRGGTPGMLTPHSSRPAPGRHVVSAASGA
jgi:hypothetical protein